MSGHFCLTVKFGDLWLTEENDQREERKRYHHDLLLAMKIRCTHIIVRAIRGFVRVLTVSCAVNLLRMKLQ